MEACRSNFEHLGRFYLLCHLEGNCCWPCRFHDDARLPGAAGIVRKPLRRQPGRVCPLIGAQRRQQVPCCGAPGRGAGRCSHHEQEAASTEIGQRVATANSVARAQTEATEDLTEDTPECNLLEAGKYAAVQTPITLPGRRPISGESLHPWASGVCPCTLPSAKPIERYRQCLSSFLPIEYARKRGASAQISAGCPLLRSVSRPPRVVNCSQ